MSAIFDNAIDSLEFGIGYFLVSREERAPGEPNTLLKHAILAIFHSVELLLKERLYRIHPILIYRNVDRRISSDSQTVGLREILARFENLGIHIPEEYNRTLVQLQRRRNRIEHHRFIDDPGNESSVAKALKFIYFFLRDHLETSLEDQLPETDTFRKVRELILDYDERLAEARSEVERFAGLAGDEPEHVCASCPACGNDTVGIETDRGNFCFFCHEEVDVEQCEVCWEYVASADITAAGACKRCCFEALEDARVRSLVT